MTLSFTTSRRFIPTLSKAEPYATPAYSFLKSLSKALRASSALREAGGPELVEVVGGGAEGPAVPSRATVTRGLKETQLLALSFTGMRTGMGFRH